MSDSLKVQPHHLERSAYLYVRQSSMRQVIENVESTKRQYALRSRAIALAQALLAFKTGAPLLGGFQAFEAVFQIIFVTHLYYLYWKKRHDAQ